MHIASPEKLELLLLDKSSHRRTEVEEFSRNIYRKFYGAELIAFPKEFIAITYKTKGLMSCLGMNYAENSPLFLEQYLDAPIEEELTAITGSNVKREEIVEIGTLAVRSRSTCRMIISALAGLLVKRRKKYLVFTAVKTLRNTLSHLEVPFTTMTTASAERVKDNSRWGNYYYDAPQVIFVDIDSCTSALKKLMHNASSAVAVGKDPKKTARNIKTNSRTEETRLRRRALKLIFMKGLLLEDTRTEETIKKAAGF